MSRQTEASAETSLLGTMAWCDTANGRLTRAEKLEFVHHVAALQAETIFDELRHRLGLLSPRAIDIDTLAPSDSALVRDVEAFGREIYDEVLWGHCLRTYYFGAIIAAHDGIAFDREVFYAAAICHDAGLGPDVVGQMPHHCFAHTGGRATRERLLLCGHPEPIVNRIADAVATHLNLFVPPSLYPAESVLTAMGALCDVLGAYVLRIAPATLRQVVERYPRIGMRELFAMASSSSHPPESRMDLLLEMNVFSEWEVHPIETALNTASRQAAAG